MPARYWVGNGGNWSDNTNHWSASTGGAPGASKPTSADDVIFDASSFSAGSQSVTQDETISFLSMNWAGVLNTPTWAGSTGTSNVYGNVTFVANMTITNNRTLYFTTNAAILTTAGKTIPGAVGVQSGAQLTLADTLTLGATADIIFLQGALITGNFAVTARDFKVQTAGAKTVTLGSSTISLSGNWDMATGGGVVTITANTATINIAGTGALTGGSLNYNGATFNLNGTAHTISGSNTFSALNFQPSGAQTITWTDGTTQTVTTMSRTGTGLITWQGSGAAGWNLTKAGGGVIRLTRIAVSRCTASPDATVYSINGVNNGNNSQVYFHFPRSGAGRLAMAGVV